MAKETLYIDADEEITSIIDKVLDSKQKVVAIVVPKRALVFQSSVNMKLLKKAALEEKKSIVLITSDPAVEAIAAVSAVHIAKSLTSKPEILKKQAAPAVATISSKELFPDSKDSIESDKDTEISDSDDPIELDNTLLATPTDDTKPEEKKKSKKGVFKIPDFSSFRNRMTLSVLLVVALVVGWIYAFVIAPKATVTVEVATSTVSASTDFTVSTKTTEYDEENSILPAKKAEVKKEDKATVEATGEKDEGEKASGSVTMNAQNCSTISTPETVAAGTIVSSNGKNFVTATPISFTLTDISGGCIIFTGSTTQITATEPGESYNIAADSAFTVSGRSDVTAVGSATGGTTKLVKVVSKEDIKKATDQLKGSTSADATTELEAELRAQQMYPLKETIKEVGSSTKVSAKEGATVSEVTVTSVVTYQMLGVSEDILNKLVDKKVVETLDDSEQNIRNNGLDTSVMRLTDRQSDDLQKLNVQVVATIGPELDKEAIKTEVAGKKRGEIEKIIGNKEGVSSVEVEYQPFWVFSTPKSANKITVVVNESTQ